MIITWIIARKTVNPQGCDLHHDWGDKVVSQLKDKTAKVWSGWFRLGCSETYAHTNIAERAIEKAPQWLWGHFWGTQYTQRMVLLAKLEGWRSYSVQSQGLLRRRVKPQTNEQMGGGKMAVYIFTWPRAFWCSWSWNTYDWPVMLNTKRFSMEPKKGSLSADVLL